MRRQFPVYSALAFLLVLTLAACGSSSTQSARPAGGVTPGPPRFGGISSFPFCLKSMVPIHDPDGIYSAYANLCGTKIVVYNLSNFILDVTPEYHPGFTNPDSQANVAIAPTSGSAELPSTEALADDAQQQAFQYSSKHAPKNAHLVPAHGNATLNGGFTPINVLVNIDYEASADSYGAEIIGGYAADGLADTFRHTPLEWGNDIAQCVNGNTELWDDFKNDHTFNQIAKTVSDLLNAPYSCQELLDKFDSSGEQTTNGVEQSVEKSADVHWVDGVEKAAEDIAHDLHG